jgi:nitrogen fixation protein
VKSAKDILTYATEGGKIMAKNGWLEEPPKMEDRNELIK